jgi:hypothetical protein
MERLAHERAIALGAAIDNTTVLTYGSALNSYIEFCRLHGFPVEPTTDTFSFYTVFMCHHIRPASVDCYLSGICNQLETHFPQVREIRKSVMVSRTLQGCKRLRGTAVRRKQPLSRDHLHRAIGNLPAEPSHDDKLFLSSLLTGFRSLSSWRTHDARQSTSPQPSKVHKTNNSRHLSINLRILASRTQSRHDIRRKPHHRHRC